MKAVPYTIVALMLMYPSSNAQRSYRGVSNQSRSYWRIFSPSDKSFKVDLPASASRIKGLYGDSDARGYKSIDVYAVQQTLPKTRGFQIIVLVPSEEMRKQNPKGNDLRGLQFTIGDDDAEPTSQSDVHMNGLRGKEFTYALTDAESARYRKGRIIDAGARIFILVYATDTAKDLNSSSARRFFSSFKVQ